MANADEKHAWVLNYLPKVLHSLVYRITRVDTQSLLEALLQQLRIPYEARTLRALVMEELFRITELETSESLQPVIRHIFECNYFVNIEDSS